MSSTKNQKKSNTNNSKQEVNFNYKQSSNNCLTYITPINDILQNMSSTKKTKNIQCK